MATKSTAKKSTAATKSVAKKASASKTTAKKAAAPRMGKPKVKVIQTVDSSPGKDTTVVFTDGTRAVIKAGNALADMLNTPEFVAPHMIQVTMSGKNIVDAEKIVLDPTGESE